MAVAIIALVKWIAIFVFVITCIAITVRTINISKPRPIVRKCKATDADFIPLDNKRLLFFQEAIRFKSIAWSPGKYESEELYRFGEFIVNAYPTIHEKSPFVEWERVNNYSLLYHIKGSNPDLKPYLLMSHLDVVPVTNPEVWDVPEFSGKIHDGFIYGRGTLDTKLTAMGILEALEYLLIHNQRPARSFHVAFGHDEEVAGLHGAAFLSRRLSEMGITEFEYVFDEGMPVTHGVFDGVKSPFANIGISEKGYLDLKLSVKGTPGHSSMPRKESVLGILARAVGRLESYPMPSMLGRGGEQEAFEAIAREMSVFRRMMLANLWLFEPVISWYLSLDPVTNSFIRTTTSVTIFNAGVKSNVIPSYAEAVINHRIHPAQTLQEVLDYDKRIIGDDRVVIEVLTYSPAHPMAGYSQEDFGYQALKTSLNQIWSDALVGPGVMIGGTDTGKYLNFTKDVYRFSPNLLVPGDLDRFHGNNERIPVKGYEQVINFYYHLMRNSDQPGVTPVHKHHEEF